MFLLFDCIADAAAIRRPVGKFLLQLCTTTPCQLCGSTEILKTIEKELGIKPGESTPDMQFSLVEVECAGACVNAPVLAVNDDYYEDLTPESTVKLLDTLKKGIIPKRGPQSSRSTCEPIKNQTTLRPNHTVPDRVFGQICSRKVI